MEARELASKVEALIGRCESLARENRELRERERRWQAERADLVRRQQVAQAKVDAMIGRTGAAVER